MTVVLKRKGEDTETHTGKKVIWRQRQGLATAKEGVEHPGTLKEAKKGISLAPLEGVWPY